ncbi:MAG: hypothetical protein ACM3SU_10985 [Acidobacteriota bacterium]
MSGRGTGNPLEEPFEARTEATAGATAFTCPLCGCRFEHGGRACGSCPMSTGCDLVKCPNCGFQFPRASRIVAWLRRIGARIRRSS